MRFDLPHALAGVVPQVGPPLKCSATPLAPTLPPPLLAEHTAVVLKQRLGMSDGEIAALVAAGAIAVRE
jgi:crotonobetainyl-CoA:carnitine CoA-transferase CaiB-like acyl-CoA transferase